jgi:predicted SpoU family rRNA methylase
MLEWRRRRLVSLRLGPRKERDNRLKRLVIMTAID